MSTTKSQTSSLLPLPEAKVKRILCPSSLTPESDEALEYALLLAQSYGAKLVCFYSIEIPDNAYKANYPEVEKNFTQALATYLTPMDSTDLNWEVVVTQGDAANKIVETAITQEIDLIVMLSRRRPLGAALLGSTAEFVCKTAPCSVLVIHPKESEWTNSDTGKIEVPRILVACDFSKYSKMAVSQAIKLAETYGSEIDLLQIIPPDTQAAWSPIFGNPIHKSMNHLAELIPESAKELKINRFVAEGEPYQEILEHVHERNIKLICMGAHSKDSKQEYLFGTTTDKVLRAASCPVLVSRFY